MGNDMILPSFTADQFLNTSEPYAWLSQFKDDKFRLQQLLQHMKAQAGAVGVKCFMSLWNSYLESEQKKNGIITDNATSFDGQPMELFCGTYICDDFGVRELDRYGYEQMICRHPIMPTKRLVNIDEGQERLELNYRKGKTWRQIIIEKSVIASSVQILQLAAYGVMVNSENAKQLSTYLLDMEELNYEIIPEQRSVGRLGWVLDHGFSPFVENLIFDGEANFRHMFSAVKSAGNRETWIEAMRKLRAEHTVGRLFLAASFASALVEPCGLLPFFVHAFGGQGTGKTVSLMIAASVWANPKMGEYVMTFNSTDVGQEMIASFLNSMPLCMDELQIQAASGIKDFDKTIYKLTEGIGRVRGAKNGGVRKTATWRNCMLTTGEYPIVNSNSMGGATVRVIEVECVKPVYSDLVGLVSILTENYGFAGREFIEYLQNEENWQTVQYYQKSIYSELLKSDGEAKQAASLSAIITADAIASELFFKDGNQLKVDDVKGIMTRKKDVDANIRALRWVQEFVAINAPKFTTNDFGEYRAEVWGKKDYDHYYIIKSVFDREMQAAGFNSKSFLSWAKRENILQTDKNRRTKNAMVNGAVVPTICLDVSALLAICDSE